MEKTLSIKQVAKYLNLAQNTIRSHAIEWGFFKMPGSRVWRINKNDLDRIKKRFNNSLRVDLVGCTNKDTLCQSTKDKTAPYGGLISQHQVGRELDALLKPVSKNKHKNSTTR
ncbi:helix-turn-helix domain-containing protein [Glaesserella sp.]|uniref:helix-turn-helix domain-containing protein n=1 Tax=Glaesserella sp. TaxID=2094731 RepID=UPI00359F7990